MKHCFGVSVGPTFDRASFWFIFAFSCNIAPNDLLVGGIRIWIVGEEGEHADNVLIVHHGPYTFIIWVLVEPIFLALWSLNRKITSFQGM